MLNNHDSNDNFGEYSKNIYLDQAYSICPVCDGYGYDIDSNICNYCSGIGRV